MYSNQEKKQLFEKIGSLSSTEHEEIFNIILRLSSNANVNYTSNKNGVFFNLSTLPNDVLGAIDTFVNFCLTNKKTLDEYEKQLYECKTSTNVINVNLENIIEIKNNKNSGDKFTSALPICDWNSANIDGSIDSKNSQKIIQFIEKLYNDKSYKKKMNIKYHNAKKKFSKKVISDSKFECDIIGDLQEEQYIFT